MSARPRYPDDLSMAFSSPALLRAMSRPNLRHITALVRGSAVTVSGNRTSGLLHGGIGFRGDWGDFPIECGAACARLAAGRYVCARSRAFSFAPIDGADRRSDH